MKKFISLILSLIMIFTMAVPAFAAEEEYPTIYVTGAQTNNLYSAEGEKIYGLGVDAGAVIKEALLPCLEELAAGMLAEDYKDYSHKVNSYVAPIFEKVVLDKNGEASNGSHPEYHSSTVEVSNKQSGYGMWDYRFWYDWRLSPVVTAAELMNYIDRVKETTGKDKVQLVGRCYGANVIQAYITLYKEHALANVSDVAYYASSVSGIDFMSALFSGDISLDSKAVSNFAEYYLEDKNVFDDDIISAFATTLIEFLHYVEVLGIGTDAVVEFVNKIKYDLIPEILPSIIGTWPSYWAMVTADKYEKAVEFIFGNRREEYAGLIEKTDYYHYNVQLCAEETILELQEKGINFYIFTKYGFPDMPLYEGAAVDSDTITSVPRQSFGAECADYGETFSEAYTSSVADTKYLSPDKKINAATALIPERSWFVRGLHHNWFAELHDMTLEIMRYDMTVDNEKYPQYLLRTDDAKLIALTGPVEEDMNKAPGFMGAIIRFVTAFMNFISKIFKGEFSFNFKEIFNK